VEQALVRVEEPVPGRPRLVGYVVAGPGHPASGLEALLTARLRDTLPLHLVPARIHVVPAFPRTVNGKVDHRALAASVEPEDAAETDLAALVARLESLTDGEVEELLAASAAREKWNHR
jgi:acyl-coenzyme A synthetase/AMP-(fatty) acid ligase